MGFLDNFLNPFSKKSESGNKYKDISKESKKLPPNTPSELLLVSRDIVGMQLQEKISNFEESRWLRADYTYPSFDDMTFIFGNRVFSVLVDICDESGESYLPEEYVSRQLHTSNGNNLIPCKFPVVIPDPRDPDISQLKPKNEGWNLFNTVTDEPIIPENLADDEKVELSVWEMRNFGINFIKKFLHAKRHKILGFQDTLEVDPQIWFEDENGKKCWMIVRCEPYSEEGVMKPVKLNEIIRRCFTYDGYFAGIMLEAKTNPESKIYRGDDVKITFNGLEKVHTVM